MKTVPTGVFATQEQLEEVTSAYQLAFCTPIMATLPGGEVPMPKEDFRDMATRFAKESGLTGGAYGIEPTSREFIEIILAPKEQPQ